VAIVQSVTDVARRSSWREENRRNGFPKTGFRLDFVQSFQRQKQIAFDQGRLETPWLRLQLLPFAFVELAESLYFQQK
jgi:hypothetical protein